LAGIAVVTVVSSVAEMTPIAFSLSPLPAWSLPSIWNRFEFAASKRPIPPFRVSAAGMCGKDPRRTSVSMVFDASPTLATEISVTTSLPSTVVVSPSATSLRRKT
jgi:hypothetical protein